MNAVMMAQIWDRQIEPARRLMAKVLAGEAHVLRELETRLDDLCTLLESFVKLGDADCTQRVKEFASELRAMALAGEALERAVAS